MSKAPNKGDRIKAVYKKNGQVIKQLDLGEVQAANKNTITDGDGNKRSYNNDALNGVVIVSFKEEKKATRKKRNKKKVLTEADALADLNDEPRPDNPGTDTAE
jgi:flagellar hook assembly protein FlgD